MRVTAVLLFVRVSPLTEHSFALQLPVSLLVSVSCMRVGTCSGWAAEVTVPPKAFQIRALPAGVDAIPLVIFSS